MTNVKLKLMFFLLNALLTADIVHARPYSNTNETDLVIKFSNNNNTFNLPVESNSDTLIVAHKEETAEESNKNSNTHMEAIMTAERDRDKDLSKKVMKEHKNETPEERNEGRNTQMEAVLNAEKGRDISFSQKKMKEYDGKVSTVSEKEANDKQLNISSSLMEDIIDSETDREETLTDIRSEFVPRFEFLIAAKINESEVTNKSVSKDHGESVNNLDKVDRNSSDVLRKVDYVELVEVVKAKGENHSAYSLVNITGHEVDNDLAPDTRFTDVQTLFLACFATLVPLLGVLFATLLIRCMCRRWCPGWCRKRTDSTQSDSSEKQDPSQQQVWGGGTILYGISHLMHSAGGVRRIWRRGTRHGRSLKSPTDEGVSEVVEDGEEAPANGSIFTMTLKNNHLIVETEERNDITKNGRETKMKYSPDNEGIFVVEVQQSTAYRPNNKSLQNSPPHDPQISTNQALIHRVPEELEKKIIEEDSEKSSEKFDRALALSSTGLSISDLSLSSLGSHNVSYSYGGQVGYEQGPFGYPLGYASYDTTTENFDERISHNISQEPLLSKTPTDPDKPVVTAAIFKQDSLINNDILQGPGYCIEGSSDGPLLSDVQAREFSLQHLHDQREKKLENGVAVPISEKIESPKKTLNRADSLPVRLEEDSVNNSLVERDSAMETIKEDSKDVEPPSSGHFKGKRASLPIIRTDVYESVKDAIRPSGSPKFEKLTNDSSPGEIMSDPPPLITITEESECGKSDSTS